jgi:hypothetical protein
MSCSECGGYGFVIFTGDYRASNGIVSKGIEQVRRCSRYVAYFRYLQLETGVAVEDPRFDGDEMIRHARVLEADVLKRMEAYASVQPKPDGCDAAVQRHRDVADSIRSKLAALAAEAKLGRKRYGR